MTVLSFAFQHTFGRETSQGFSDTFFWRCIRASKASFVLSWTSSALLASESISAMDPMPNASS
ncbi:hypothetical protein FKP32DRAFT_1670631 [Trametes sanguinea]|nr:hypothetical protein FKP32DRAFT_1670631 [Trametes sanguinea]